MERDKAVCASWYHIQSSENPEELFLSTKPGETVPLAHCSVVPKQINDDSNNNKDRIGTRAVTQMVKHLPCTH